jgi:transposase
MYDDMKLWNEVRRAVLVDGLNHRQACQKFGIHDDTLKKMLAHPEPPGFQLSEPRGKPVIGPFLPIIEEILKSDQGAPVKQRHDGQRILERLREEHGYQGSDSTFYRALGAIQKRSRPVYVPLKHPPGEAQFDFGFAYVRIDGVVTRIAFAELSLPYSNVRYCQVFPGECTESFQEGLKRAFHFLGGVPTLIKFDNSKVAVRKIVGMRGDEATSEFLRIASHFLFEHYFCRVRQPQEKGHVENAVKYSRSKHMVPMPELTSFDAFNRQLEERCRADMLKTSARKEKTIAELFDEEKKSLLPLPEEEFEARRIELRHANSLSLVRFHNNDYSIPTEYAHHEITVIGGVDVVKFLVLGRVVALHKRDWRKNKTHYNPIHYLALAERKPNSLDFGKPFEDWDLPKDFDVLRRRLERSAGKQGFREYLKILRLLESHSPEQLAQAVRRALELKAVSYETIRCSIHDTNDVALEFFALDGRPLLQAVKLDPPNLDVYTQYAKEQQDEKTRNEIDSPFETSFETTQAPDDGERMRRDRDAMREGERRSPRLPVATGRARTPGSRSESRRTKAQGREVPEPENPGELRLQSTTVVEQDACQRTDARDLPRQSRSDHHDRPARHRQDAPGDGLRRQGVSTRKEGAILSRHRPHHEDDRSPR